MRILMVSNTYLPIVGGLEKSIQSFTQKFRQWGHRVVIAVPELESLETAEDDLVRVPAMHSLKKMDFPIPLPIFSSLSKIVEEIDPDVIHVHHPFLMGEMALRLSVRYSKPLVFTYHILFDLYAHYLPIPAAPAGKFLTELAAGFSNLSTRVIAPSESVREIIRRQGVKTPVDVVPTGVEVENFARGEREKMRDSLGIPRSAKVLGYVGRLAPEKNLEFLARMAASFMQLHPPVHFVAAGKGPAEEKMIKIFADADLRGRFHFPGILQGQELADCYHAMDIFIFSSKSETQGMVLCEAMAAGVPVAAMDAPGVREVVKDRENGRLLARESRSEFHSVLEECLSCSPEEWERLKRGARKTAKTFSAENCAARAFEVYKEAISEKPSPVMERHREWHRLTNRFGIEWKLMANFGRASGLALKEMVKSHD